jgi:DNA-binding beta-propeller fold protein YncE
MKYGKIFIKIILVLALSTSHTTALASSTYPSYTYDEWGGAVSAPESYLPGKIKNGFELGCGPLKEPKDFFMDGNGRLYISDTGNNRIIITDEQLNLMDEISKVEINGIEEPLTSPEGLFIAKDGTLYIAQAAKNRVLILKGNKVIQIIEKPESSLIPADFVFSPIKVGVDIYGRIYVLSKGCYSGLLKFSAKGIFLDYFGANKVEITPEMLLNYTWKSILSEEQRAAMTSILPIEYSNIDCSDDGFVYTTTVGTETPVDQVKKLNPLGNNTYYSRGKEKVNFGDLEISYIKAQPLNSSFVDLKVDNDGFIFGLDLTKGRIFERDQEGNLLAVFGGLGNQKGTFLTPAAVEYYNGNVYVLDSMKNNITIFEPTDYEAMIRSATILYSEGRYQESAIIWEKVLQRNINSTLAYVGKGKALTQSGDYSAALEAFRSGADRFDYSRSFMKYRLVVIREHAPKVLVGFILLSILIKGTNIFRKYKKRRKKA